MKFYDNNGMVGSSRDNVNLGEVADLEKKPCTFDAVLKVPFLPYEMLIKGSNPFVTVRTYLQVTPSHR